MNKKYENKNAYEIVDILINEDLRCSISDNELKYDMPDGNIVLALLKHKYNAKYIDSDDAHFCGSYYFYNPNYIKVNKLILGFHFWHSPYTDNEIDFYYVGDNNDDMVKEIIRLENVSADKHDEIKKQLDETSCYIGENRLWMVKTYPTRIRPDSEF